MWGRVVRWLVGVQVDGQGVWAEGGARGGRHLAARAGGGAAGGHGCERGLAAGCRRPSALAAARLRAVGGARCLIRRLLPGPAELSQINPGLSKTAAVCKQSSHQQAASGALCKGSIVWVVQATLVPLLAGSCMPRASQCQTRSMNV